MGKKITVIVPVYNTKKFLTRCVNSILKQSYENLEVIIIDDGSTDGSAQVCDELSKSDKRVRVIHQKNKGIATTRNIGIELARGKYLCFIDSDDYIENNYVEMLVGNIHENAVTFCGYFVDTYKENGNIASIPKIYRKENGNEISNNLVYVFHQGFLSVIWNKIYDVSRLRENNIKFDEKLSLGEDLLFNLGYLKTGIEKIQSVDNSLYHYIKRGTESLDNKYRSDFLEIQERIFSELIITMELYNVSCKKKSLIYFDFMGAIIVSIDNYYAFEYKKQKNRKALKKVIENACDIIKKYQIIKMVKGKAKVICIIRFIMLKLGMYKIDYMVRNFLKKLLRL